MESLILEILSKYPTLAVVLTVVAVARAVNKPLFAFLRALAEATPTPADNLLLEKAEGSKLYKAICFVLDYTLSIKLPVK